ncbi:MAG TPA: hypothetical protein VF704_01140 [Allosphingosinicella sp.]
MTDPSKSEKTDGAEGKGQSGGGAYPNPHSGKAGDGKGGGGKDGFFGSGGQSEMEYHGGGRLGEDEVGGNANAPAKGTKPDPR